MNSAKPKTPAPYGQACTNCVKAKCRCILRDGGICERCHRLGKECSPSSSVRKGSTKRPTASKRSQLEDKLEDIVSLLRTQHAAPQHDPPTFPQALTPRSSDYSPQQGGLEVPSCTLTNHELAKFRRLHLSHFPFIHLPLSLSADQLQREKPILSLAIHTICNKAHSQQTALAKRLREIVSSQLLVDGEKSLDLLLGIEACMAWSLYVTFSSRKGLLTMFAAIARPLLCDLRLDKPQHLSWCPSRGPPMQDIDTTPRSSESRRAVLAYFVLSAMISTTLKHDNMPWSSQLEEDCVRLTSEGETEGDAILVAMVRISKILNQTANLFRYLYDNPEGSRHALLHIEPLKRSLDQVRGTLSDQQIQHRGVVVYLYGAEISIYELAIISQSGPPSQQSFILDHKRTDYLMACLQACKSCTEYDLSLDLFHSTTPSTLVFSYCIKVLHQLSTLHDVGWDPAIVRESVDIIGLLDRWAASADRANMKCKEETGEDSVFSLAARTLRDTIPHWCVGGPEVRLGDVAGSVGWAGGGVIDLPSMDFSDDFWLSGPFNL